MTLSEYISVLKSLVDDSVASLDMEVVDSYDDQVGTPEVIDGCVVLCDKA